MSYPDIFVKSCDNADQFPKNILQPTLTDDILTDYYERLNSRQDLFSPEDEATLEIWEYSDEIMSKFVTSVIFTSCTNQRKNSNTRIRMK